METTQQLNQKHPTQKRQSTWIPAVCRCEVFGFSFLAVHLMNQRKGERSKEASIRQKEHVPAAASSELKKKRQHGDRLATRGSGAKHQALKTTQVLHLCSCKRYADRKKVETQAEDYIRILCQWKGSKECNISQLAECKRNLGPPAAALRLRGEDCASQLALC